MLSARPKTRRTVAARLSPTRLQPSIPSDGDELTSRSPSVPYCGQRNIDRLCITCASRLRLSSRLTLIRLTLFRNPWAFGGAVSSALIVTYAYIFFSVRSSIPRRYAFFAARNAPLPRHAIADEASSASAVVLMPGHHPRVTARLVSCYALFE